MTKREPTELEIYRAKLRRVLADVTTKAERQSAAATQDMQVTKGSALGMLQAVQQIAREMKCD